MRLIVTKKSGNCYVDIGTEMYIIKELFGGTLSIGDINGEDDNFAWLTNKVIDGKIFVEGLSFKFILEEIKED